MAIPILPRWVATLGQATLVAAVGFLLNRSISQLDQSIERLENEERKTATEVAEIRGFLSSHYADVTPNSNIATARVDASAPVFPLHSEGRPIRRRPVGDSQNATATLVGGSYVGGNRRHRYLRCPTGYPTD
jgi:hypothetical protein